MNIDERTLYIIYIVLALAVAAVIVWWILRLRRHRAFALIYEEQSAPIDPTSLEWPRLSIVVICQEKAKALERSLPALLTQQYTHYEVVVVNAASTDDTDDVIQRAEQQYDHLRHTFISPQNQIENMETLTLMLGLRSARADWVMLTTPGGVPETKEWLMRMARHISDDADLIIGTGQGEGATNLLFRKDKLEQSNYDIEQFERTAHKIYEWSPQACIYQRE